MPSPFETLDVRQDGAVWFASINAPPMNLLGPELVRDLSRDRRDRRSARLQEHRS
jgi:hypothetical protein